jgi:hypothetical protein
MPSNTSCVMGPRGASGLRMSMKLRAAGSAQATGSAAAGSQGKEESKQEPPHEEQVQGALKDRLHLVDRLATVVLAELQLT